MTAFPSFGSVMVMKTVLTGRMNRRIAKDVNVQIRGSDATQQVNVFPRSGSVMERMIVEIQLLLMNILTMDAMLLFANRTSSSVTTSNASFNDSTVMLMMTVVMAVMNHLLVPWLLAPRITTSARTNDAFPKNGSAMASMIVVMILMKIFALKTRRLLLVLKKSSSVRTRNVSILQNSAMDPMIVMTSLMNDIATLMNVLLVSLVLSLVRIVLLGTSAPASQVSFFLSFFSDLFVD